jgi:hypothetical protein
VEVKEEEDNVAVLLHQQRLNATIDDPSDTPRFNAVFMASLNDHSTWAGNIDDVIALFIRERGRPLVDLTRDDGEVGPSDTVKEEPADDRCGPHEHFYQHYRRIEHRGRC